MAHCWGDLDFDLSCSELAVEFWAGRPGHPEQVLGLLTELAAERRRHRDATAALAARLAAFADEAHLTEADHVHREPIEAYRARVRQRLYPDL